MEREGEKGGFARDEREKRRAVGCACVQSKQLCRRRNHQAAKFEGGVAVVDKEDEERVGRAWEDIAVADSDIERDVGGIEDNAIEGCIGCATARPCG